MIRTGDVIYNSITGESLKRFESQGRGRQRVWDAIEMRRAAEGDRAQTEWLHAHS